MLEKGFLKPIISTEKIGKRQFWIGLLIGVFFAFIINHFFIVSREVLRSLTFIRDPFILSNKDFKLYDLFFAAFSTSLGFGITIICWLYTPNRKIKKGYLKTYSVATSFICNMACTGNGFTIWINHSIYFIFFSGVRQLPRCLK